MTRTYNRICGDRNPIVLHIAIVNAWWGGGCLDYTGPLTSPSLFVPLASPTRGLRTLRVHAVLERGLFVYGRRNMDLVF